MLKKATIFTVLFILAIQLCGMSPYSTSISKINAEKQNPDLILLKMAKFDIRKEIPTFNNIGLEHLNYVGDRNREFYIIHFIGAVREDWKAQIRKLGGKFYGYIPNHSFIVRIPNDKYESVKKLRFVNWIGDYKPAYRISPKLLEPQYAETKKEFGSVKILDKEGTIMLLVEVFEDEDWHIVENRIAQLDCEILAASGRKPYPGYIKIRIPEGKATEIATEIAKMPEVSWVERYYVKQLYNSWTCWITQSRDTVGMGSTSAGWYRASKVDATHTPIYSHNLYGQGQIVGEGDTGIDWDGRYFDETSSSMNFNGSGSTFSGTPSHKIQGYQTLSDDHDGASNNCDGSGYGSSGHGTHTACTIAGDSTSHHYNFSIAHPDSGDTIIARGDGAAPLAKIAFQDISTTPSCGNDGSLDGIPSDLNADYFPWAYNAGARIHSNSWGGSASNYTTDSRNCDRFMWEHQDFLILFAMGNSGPSSGTIGEPATAKDIISVGASQSGAGCNVDAYCDANTQWQDPGSPQDKYGYNGGDWTADGIPDDDIETVGWFSSHGPSDEGLLKPEVCTPGGHMTYSAWSDGDPTSGNPGTGETTCNSATSNGTYLCQMGGTSMACPYTAGLCALIRQYYTEGWYPSGTKTPADTITPSGALIKATLINSTRNMTGYYTSDNGSRTVHADVPTNGQGWGRVVLDDALFFAGDTRALLAYDVSAGLSNGQADTFTFTTGSSTTEKIKIVLCWTDYYGTQSSSDPLVNDLDLEVDFNGNTYKGNVFSGGLSTTGGTKDAVNATEVVWLNTVPSTACTIRIIGADINQSTQPFAVAITADIQGASDHAPNAPTLNKLFDNERMASTTPTLEWNVPADDDGDNLHFKVQIDDNADFSSPFATIESKDNTTGFSPVPPVTEGSGTCSYAVGSQGEGSLTDSTTYYWRVAAYDGTIYGDWSSVRSFTVNTAQAESDWFQTMDAQFTNDTLTDATTNSNAVEVAISAGYSETLQWDDGTAASQWSGSGINYWAVQFTPAANCTITQVQYCRLTEKSENDTIYIRADNSGSPGALIEKIPNSTSAQGNGASIPQWYNVNTTHNYISGTSFWFCLYARSDNAGVNESYLTGDGDGGEHSYYSGDGSSWTNMAAAGYLSDFLMRSVVKYPGSTPDSGIVVSTPIVYSWSPNSPTSWGNVYWSESSGDSIKIKTQYKSSGAWTNFDSAFATGTFTAGTLDISSLGTTDTIRLVGILYTKSGVSPTMTDWTATWNFTNVAIQLLVGDSSGPDYTNWALGMLTPSQVKIMDATDRVFVKNTGSVNMDVKISASAVSWTYSDASGSDQCVLMALFNGTTVPVADDFSTSYDTLGTNLRDAGISPDGKFAGISNDGVDIPTASGEELYFYFKAPDPNSEPNEQTITIIVQAVEHIP